MKNLLVFALAIALVGAACSGDETNSNLVEVSESATAIPTQPADAPVATTAPIASGGSSGSTDSSQQAAPQSPADADDATANAASEPEPTVERVPFDEAASQERARQTLAAATDWCSASALMLDSFDAFEAVDVTDPAAFELVYRDAYQVLVQMQELAPVAIQSDLETSNRGFALLLDELEQVEWLFLDLEPQGETGLDEKVRRANYNLDSYQFEECGIGTAPPEFAEFQQGSTEADSTLPDGFADDQAIAALVSGGFSTDEATCLVDNVDFVNEQNLATPDKLVAAFSECGIPLDRLDNFGS